MVTVFKILNLIPSKKEVQKGREVDNTNGSVKGFPHHIYVNVHPRVHIARWLMAYPLIFP